MRSLLPESSTIIGVDEHTALTIDLDAAVASVSGLGTVTILTDAGSEVMGAGDEATLSELGSAVDATTEHGLAEFAPSDPESGDPFAAGWRELEQRFEPALLDGDLDAALDSVVGLHQLILDWAADTNQSPESERAERALRGMLVRLARIGATRGTRSPGTRRWARRDCARSADCGARQRSLGRSRRHTRPTRCTRDNRQRHQRRVDLELAEDGTGG